MKITAVKTALMGVQRQSWLFVTIETDEGISGIGEASLEGKEKTVETAVHEFARRLIGEDPARITHHWQVLHRHGFWRGGVVLNSALSAVEQALWDIKGKVLGVPVYDLLGGRTRDRIRVYTHCGGPTPEAAAERAQAFVADGFTALKFGSWPEGDGDERAAIRWVVRLIETVRNAVGPEIDLMVDNHGRGTPGGAIAMARALEPYGLLFFEEPTPPDNLKALAKLAEAKPNLPLATGERLFTKWGFRELIEGQMVDIVQPDICHAGGIGECFAIAKMAEVAYMSVAPHNPNGPVATAASVQLAAAIPNFTILEWAHSEPHRSQVQCTGPTIVDGHINLPAGPGLGIELDPDVIARYPYVVTDYPGVFAADGSVADV